MGLNAATALLDLATAKSFLVVVGAADDGPIEAAITAASTMIEDYCNRLFLERTISERVEGPRGAHLWLQAVPLKAAAAVTVAVDDVVQTVWKEEADGLPSSFDVIARPDHLYRRCGWGGAARDPYNVLLTYTGGYAAAALPAPVKQACCYVVQKLFRDSKRQLAEIAQVNTPMGGVSLLDSGLPRMARLLLDPYRLRIAA